MLWYELSFMIVILLLCSLIVLVNLVKFVEKNLVRCWNVKLWPWHGIDRKGMLKDDKIPSAYVFWDEFEDWLVHLVVVSAPQVKADSTSYPCLKIAGLCLRTHERTVCCMPFVSSILVFYLLVYASISGNFSTQSWVFQWIIWGQGPTLSSKKKEVTTRGSMKRTQVWRGDWY